MGKTRERIRESNLRYRQSLGQNFIYDEDILAALVREAGIDRETDVLEIGPGVGTLTKHLCAAAGHVVSVELDERLIPLLNAFMAEERNFTLVQGDVMRVNLREVTAPLRKPFTVAANIPYYITTPLIQRLLTSGLEMNRLCLMVQKEVADKILSGPGEEGWGSLAVRCQYLCEPRRAMEVPAACFTPPPKVDSTFLVLTARKEPPVRAAREEDFFRVAGAAFALRRKTMLNNLCASFRLERAEAAEIMREAGLDEKVRGEQLGMEEMAGLANVLTRREEAGK